MKVLSIIFLLGSFMIMGCDIPQMRRTPNKITYKEKLKRHGDSVWFQVSEYSLDTTYQELIMDRSSATVLPE